ncbi:MAG: hypothetical protein RR743_03550 [Oscillospiraceae bacterium]
MCFFLFSLCFVGGCLIGGLMGAMFSSGSEFTQFTDSTALGGTNYLLIFYRLIRFQLIAILLGSSILGVAFLPLLCGARGYALSCAAATIISASPDKGIIMALIILGVPAIFSLPCFFAASVDAFFCSRKLCYLLRGACSPAPQRLLLRFLVYFSFTALAAFLEMQLVPYLVSLLI